MKRLLLVVILCGTLLVPCFGKPTPSCQQGCLAGATAYVYECANNGGTDCTQKAHDLSYCPCMSACMPNPVQECTTQ